MENRVFVNSFTAFSGVLVATTAFVILQGSGEAKAEPRPEQTAKLYCKAHPNYSGPSGERTREELPSDVRASRYATPYWRCKEGQVWVCEGGMSGFDCAQTGPMDAERLREMRKVCSQNPNLAYIGRSLTVGLASSWRCVGGVPTMIRRIPVDKAGFMVEHWRLLR